MGLGSPSNGRSLGGGCIWGSYMTLSVQHYFVFNHLCQLLKLMVTTLPSNSPMPWMARTSAEVGHQGDAMLIGGHAVAAAGDARWWLWHWNMWRFAAGCPISNLR
jgi:hypothetical protein